MRDKLIQNRNHHISLSGLIDPEEAKLITPIGGILRKTGIDELPQIWNILVRRDMQLLGIRPIMLEEYELLPEDLQEKIISEKPGLIPAEAKYSYEVGNLNSRIEAMQEYFRARPKGAWRLIHAIEALIRRVLIYSKR